MPLEIRVPRLGTPLATVAEAVQCLPRRGEQPAAEGSPRGIAVESASYPQYGAQHISSQIGRIRFLEAAAAGVSVDERPWTSTNWTHAAPSL
jgi:hypothetical protein